MVKKSMKLTCPVCGQIMDSEWPCGSCLAIRVGIAYFDDNGDFRMKRHYGNITPAVVTRGTSSRSSGKVKEQIPKKAKEQVLKAKKEKEKKKEKSTEQEFEYEESEEEIDFNLIDEW